MCALYAGVSCVASISMPDLKYQKAEPSQIIGAGSRPRPKFQYPIVVIYHLRFEWAKNAASRTVQNYLFFASRLQKNSVKCVPGTGVQVCVCTSRSIVLCCVGCVLVKRAN